MGALRRRRVLVTGVGGRSVGSGILHALQRARGGEAAARWEVVAADADPFAWGLYAAPLRVVLPRAHEPSYLSRVAEVIAQLGIVAVLPGTEAETAVLAANPTAVAPAVAITNRPELMDLMMDKRRLFARLTELGVDTPRTQLATTWRELVDAIGFPVLFKPAIRSGGSRGVRIATDEDAARRILEERAADIDTTIVQECLPFEDDEFTVGILSDRDGRIIDSIVLHRKLVGLSRLDSVVHGDREYAVSSGYSQGFISERADVRDACERLARLLGSCGPLNVQLRAHRERIVVFEVHPRFSGTTPIRADAGLNEPDLLLRNALDGERFGRMGVGAGMVAIRAFEHVLVPLKDFEAMGGRPPR